MTRQAAPILFVGLIGPPGSGKSTLAARLHTSLNAPVIRPRNAIRSTVENHPKLHELFTPINKLGWVSDGALGLAVRTAVASIPHTCDLALLENLPGDGFQVADIHALARQRGGTLLVIHLDGDDDTFLARGRTRQVCQECDSAGSADPHEPAIPDPVTPTSCARCGTPLTTRPDDEYAVLRERITRHRIYAGEMLRTINALEIPLAPIDATADPATTEALALQAITIHRSGHM